ncbi:MAG: 4-(cytidine 5'-diphospho)-2-C-methyl-D-erythritol kinase [Cyclobacteriaceae bacterium]
MVAFPPCKINLGLNITGKRADGYHDIITCFYPVPWNDVLEILPAKDFAFSLSGEPVPGTAADNLCVRAYQVFKNEYDLRSVAIHLLKTIPMGAGLGGGSSDGAWTLRILNQLFSLSISAGQMNQHAAQLGSDCPFFLQDKPMIGTGRGDVLSPVSISLKDKFLVIVKPEVHISTAEAYAGITPRTPATDLRQVLETRHIRDWKQLLKNDFQEGLFGKFPIIEALYQKLYAFGATYVSMSGSGSSVYGIFDQEVDLKKEFEGMVYWSAYLD